MLGEDDGNGEGVELGVGLGGPPAGRKSQSQPSGSVQTAGAPRSCVPHDPQAETKFVTEKVKVLGRTGICAAVGLGMQASVTWIMPFGGTTGGWLLDMTGEPARRGTNPALLAH